MSEHAPDPEVPGLRVRLDGGVLRCTFDRPEARNALTDRMVDCLADHLERAQSRDEVRAVVLTGTGGAFSAGADIGGVDAHERFDVSALDRANRMIRAVVGLDKPVLAAVDGVAAGVGASLAVASDVLVVSERARLLFSFALIGLMPDGGATATLAASLGRARALRMALLAEPLTAEEARSAGLVAQVVPPEQLEETTSTLAATVAAGPPLAYAAAKRAINAATLAGLEDSLETERRQQTMLLGTADVAEGMAAFSQKRAPAFRGE